MAGLKTQGEIGSQNYRVADCPFYVPKENLKFMNAMRTTYDKCVQTNYDSYPPKTIKKLNF